MLDACRKRSDELRESAGADDRAGSDLGLDAIAQPIDLGGEPIDRARLNRLDRGLAEHTSRCSKFDRPERRGPTNECIHGNFDTRGDRATEIHPIGRDGIAGRGRSEISDDRRTAVEVERSDGIGDAIGTDLLRIVVLNTDTGANTGFDHDWFEIQMTISDLAQRGGDPRNT